ncbi:MAG: TonB family protein [Flammeovirgaceae bacterium]|nr:TonB family protein [Flammeovirgaceae bacterium]
MAGKYKVVKSNPPIAKEEINQLKDFDKVLARAEGANKVNPNFSSKYTALISLLFFVSVGTGIVIFVSENTDEIAIKQAVEKNIEPEKTKPESIAKLDLEPVVTDNNKPKNEYLEVEKVIDETELTSEFSEPILENKTTLNPKIETNKVTESFEKKEKIAIPNDTQIAYEYEEASPIVGFDSLYNYMAKAIQYPEELKQEKVEGKVMLEFEINEKGATENIKVLEGLNTLLDEEAKRIIREMPAWYPAKVYGSPIRSKMRIPLTFQINQPIE